MAVRYSHAEMCRIRLKMAKEFLPLNAYFNQEFKELINIGVKQKKAIKFKLPILNPLSKTHQKQKQKKERESPVSRVSREITGMEGIKG